MSAHQGGSSGSGGAKRRWVAVVGDASRVQAWSGIAYHFMDAGRRAGWFAGGLPLQPERLAALRLLWNLTRPLFGQRPGGFQYTPLFLEALFQQADMVQDGDEIFSHFPLLPPPGRNLRATYYIDATLRQNFRDYGAAAGVGEKIMQDTLDREKAQYERAHHVVCMASWAAESVIHEYGIDPAKVKVILPGANIEDDLADAVKASPRTDAPFGDGPVRLGFIGKDWRRKGLTILMDVADRLGARGIACEIVVLGHTQDTLPRHPALRPQGFIDKNGDTRRFAELVRSFHFGCLMSDVEALGISTLEALRLGVPALGTRVGGIVDTISPCCGFLVSFARAAEETTDIIEGFYRAPERYQVLAAHVAEHAPHYSWARTIRDFQALPDDHP